MKLSVQWLRFCVGQNVTFGAIMSLHFLTIFRIVWCGTLNSQAEILAVFDEL